MSDGLAGDGDISLLRSGIGDEVTPRFRRLGTRRPEAGDAEESRLRGLRMGREEETERGVKPLDEVLRCGVGVGVVADRGLQLWPTTRSFVLKL